MKTSKEKCIEYLGGNVCHICKRRKPLSELVFHHLRNKKYTISSMLTKDFSWDKIRTELKKCVVVCNNCHFWFHRGLIKMPDDEDEEDEIVIIDEPENYNLKKKDKLIKPSEETASDEELDDKEDLDIETKKTCVIKIGDFQMETPIINNDILVTHETQMSVFFTINEYLKQGKLPDWYSDKK